MESTRQRIIRSVRDVTPGALKTSWWLVRIMFIVTFVITILNYLGVISWISVRLTPLFHCSDCRRRRPWHMCRVFVNCYSAIAVITTLDMDPRAITILAVMVLCAHNIPMETAVQKKPARLP